MSPSPTDRPAPKRRARRIRVGDRAPDVALPDADGKTVRLSEFRGRSAVVLYFYPGDFTPGCTLEACAFRDAYEAFVEAGATVIGVSADAGGRHSAFSERFSLPFVLLSDPEGEARRAFGVGRTLGILPGRVTFIIDREGMVRHVFSSQLRPRAHMRRALEVLSGLGRG